MTIIDEASRGGHRSQHFIWVVDDDPDIREMLADLLGDLCDGVVVFPNGRVALDQLHRGGALPRLVILDLVMPVMTGEELLAEMKKDPHLSRVPVVIFSGEAPPTHRGGVAFLNKPARLGELVDLVGRLLSEPSDSLDRP